MNKNSICIMRRFRRKIFGFTFIELMVVVAVIGILAIIAIPQVASIRQKRIRQVAMDSLPALTAWEESRFERTGSFVYSLDGTDAISWTIVTASECAGQNLGPVLRDAANGEFTPTGCTFDFYVIDDYCHSDCDAAGDGVANGEGLGRLYCAMAFSKTTWSGGTQQLPTNGDAFCMDKTGAKYSNRQIQGWQ